MPTLPTDSKFAIRFPQDTLRYSHPTVVYTSWEVIVCVKVLRPSQPTGVVSSAVSLHNHTFTEQV